MALGDGSEIGRLIRYRRTRSERPRRIAHHRGGGGHVAGHHGASAHNCPLTHAHAGQQEGAGADESVGADVDRGGLQGPGGIAQDVTAGAEVGLLGHTGTGADLHRAKAVGMGAVAQAGMVLEGEVPGVIDAGPLVHKGLAVERGPEAAQDEQAPRVAGFGGPGAEQRPGKLPEQLAQAVATAPGAGIAAGLGVGVHQFGRWIMGQQPASIG